MSPWIFSLLILIFSNEVFASFQSGISFEVSAGYPQMTAQLSGSEARYTGTSMNASLILPLLDYARSSSIDFTLGYRFANYQNSASNGTAAEWSQLQGFTPGFRLNLKYFFFGADVIFLQGRHLVAGSNSEIFDYNINPIQGVAGVNFPLIDDLSVAVSYKQHLATGKATLNGSELTVNEQIFLVSLQFDLGIGFLNVIEEDSTFKFIEDNNL